MGFSTARKRSYPQAKSSIHGGFRDFSTKNISLYYYYYIHVP